MLLAIDISLKQNLIREQAAGRIEGLIKAVGLPVSIKSSIPLERIIRAYYHDKKFIGLKNRLVLLSGIGKTRIVEGIPLDMIRGAIKSMKK